MPSFEELGLLETIKKIAESPRGIVLVAGSTGCGKSTTLAAMIEHINANFNKHIITMEDPIEYVFEDNQSVIEQREIGLDTLSFEHALKHVLRQDPDIIMIGEMRDSTSFTAAMSAADTGHLCCPPCTPPMPRNPSAASWTFSRRTNASRSAGSLAGTLAGGGLPAHGQHRHRRSDARPGNPDQHRHGQKIDRGKPAGQTAGAIETGSEDGMQNFNQALFQLVKERKVSEKEALAKATNAQALEMNFKGIFLDEGRRILGDLPPDLFFFGAM